MKDSSFPLVFTVCRSPSSCPIIFMVCLSSPPLPETMSLKLRASPAFLVPSVYCLEKGSTPAPCENWSAAYRNAHRAAGRNLASVLSAPSFLFTSFSPHTCVLLPLALPHHRSTHPRRLTPSTQQSCADTHILLFTKSQDTQITQD